MIRTARRLAPGPGPPARRPARYCGSERRRSSGSSSTSRSAADLNKGRPVAWVASGERMPNRLFERVEVQPRRRRVRPQRMAAAHGVEGVDAVVDMDLVAAPAKRLAEPLDVGGVAAEAVRPEERRDHARISWATSVSRHAFDSRVALPRFEQLGRARTCQRPQHSPPELRVTQTAQRDPARRCR